MDWRNNRDGSKNGMVILKHAKRTNWYHPFLWVHITRAAKKGLWSARSMETILRHENPDLFNKLHAGTIQRWLDGHGFTATTLENVKQGHVLAASGRVGVLTGYPNIVNAVKEKLVNLRTSGVPVGVFLAHTIMLSIIQNMHPQLLEIFTCSESYDRGFLQSTLDWTPHKATRAAAHVPANAISQCTHAFFRLVHLMKHRNIPPKLVIFMDQTGKYLMGTKDKTYNKRGSKQIDLAAKDEKRAYTLCVSTTANGDVLPFQQVWSGKTRSSLPKDDADGMSEAKELGFDFACAASDKKTSHFSTLKTMKEVRVHHTDINNTLTDNVVPCSVGEKHPGTIHCECGRE